MAAAPLRRALLRAAATATGSMSQATTRRAQTFSRRDRQHAGAGAEIEHAPRAPPLRQSIERQQAAARGAVVAGTESKRRLDFDADGVDRHPRAVMGAVHDKAAGAYGAKPARLCATQSVSASASKAQRLRRLIARGQRDQRAHRGLIRRGAEMHRHLPAAAVVLEGGADCVVRIEASRRARSPVSGRSAGRRRGGRR